MLSYGEKKRDVVQRVGGALKLHIVRNYITEDIMGLVPIESLAGMLGVGFL